MRSTRLRLGSCASRPWGNMSSNTGMLRKGPEISMSDSHSAWWRAMDMGGTSWGYLRSMGTNMPTFATVGCDNAFSLFHLVVGTSTRADTSAMGAINWPLRLTG